MTNGPSYCHREHLGKQSYPLNYKWISCEGVVRFSYKWGKIDGKIATYQDKDLKTFVGYNRDRRLYRCDGVNPAEFKAVQPDTESEIHAIRAERSKLEESLPVVDLGGGFEVVGFL